ncbi:helix-turn-helix transcriptional regulator [Cucumibacter marinus]|uniref:helix-turn-helix transcriptional regulator n=1 Tax=Cucumibacter marinus TaxID=1121252 RepID=UPI0004072620|nr:hypothetical protein [Cucumibacter marinus]
MGINLSSFVGSHNALIGSIYDLALGRASWDSILDTLSATCPECLVMVSGDDLASGRNLAFAHRGLASQAIPAYMSTYSAQNPWHDAQAEMPVCQVYQDEQILERAELAASAFYKDWLGKQGRFDAGVGAVILREGSRQLTIDIRFDSQANPELRDRATRLLSEATAHFARAFEIVRRHRSDRPGPLEDLVETLPFAVFTLTEDMRIQYANGPARSISASNYFLTADNSLRICEQEGDDALRQLISRAAGSKRPVSAALQLSEPSGGRSFAIARRADSEAHAGGLHDAVLGTGPLVILALHHDHDDAVISSDMLWRLFGFTDAEANLAEALLSGATLGDFAKEREVSKQTVRNQLVGVMRKTGTRRQSELLLLLSRLSLSSL